MWTRLSRWWTPSNPPIPDAHARIDGWAYPLVPVTRELREDSPEWMAYILANHRVVHHDFNCDIYVYAWWPIAPLALAWFWWFRAPRRWCIERALRRAGLAELDEGDYWRSWRLRDPARWPWRVSN